MKNTFLFLILALVFVVVMMLPDGVSRKNRAAEKKLCAEMADEVLAGTASRFDYMATRCPAQLIMAPEGS